MKFVTIFLIITSISCLIASGIFFGRIPPTISLADLLLTKNNGDQFGIGILFAFLGVISTISSLVSSNNTDWDK